MGLIAAAVVPVWLFAAYVLVSFALSQQEGFRDRAIEMARQAAAIVDSELNGMLLRIDALARSAAFAEGDFARLHAEAQRLVSGSNQTIILRTEAGRQLLNTGLAPGQPMPSLQALSAVELEGLAAGQPRVSDVHADAASGAPSVSVMRRLQLKDGSPVLLVITAPTAALHRILRVLAPKPWVIGVGDRTGVYVTRSERHDEVTGTPGVATYLSRALGSSGSFTADNQFGDTLLAGYVRSDFSGWLHAANVDLSLVEAPLWRSLFSILAIGALALAVSLVLALAVGKVLTGDTSSLARQALMLGAGKPVERLPTRLREFELVSAALADADADIRKRTSELQAVLDTVPVAVWFTYDPTGRQVIRNRLAAELMNVPDDHEHPFGAPDPVIETVAFKDGEVVSREDRPLTRAMRGQETDHEEFLYRLPTGREFVLSSSARAIRGEDGKVVGAVQISLDVTERKRAEDQRKLLTRELDHRVKNNLAIVQSLVQQTLRNAKDLEEARSVVRDRLSALAQAHDVLARNAWLEGDLHTTIAAAVQAEAKGSRVRLTGPELMLPPGFVMTISLAMHELMTNAVKYGALSIGDGRIEISWQVTEGPDAELVVRWQEAGGPPVSKPSRLGFGSRLLERMTQSEGGSAERTFGPSGLVCVLRLPWRPS